MTPMVGSTAQPTSAVTADVGGKDFIRRIVDEDIQAGRNQGHVVTRFPPEPNGFLHIGHAKSICLNFGIANEQQSVCHLRFDDTDPTKEDVTYENAIKEDIHWLGFDWQGRLFHASDYFEKMYEYALQLINDGKAYVCSLNEEEIRQYRGTVTTPGVISPYAARSVSENLELFTSMRAGKFADGTHVLRARIDMASANMKMRDPLLYRIRHAHHYMTGDKWCLYPMYDYAHPISDALEGITHSICTLEFENNRELYDWVLDNITAPFPSRPHQYEFARLDLQYAVMSKRRLLELVEKKMVAGWDDPRLPTISGLRRRGCTPEAIRKFCELVGVAKANSTVDIAQFDFCIRDDLNSRAPRVMAVLNPLRVVIENYPADKVEQFDAPYWPHDIPKEGSRRLPFCREIYIERDDFMEIPSRDFYRLIPGGEVRLRHGYCITCTGVIKDPDSGEVVELRCQYDPETLGAAPQGRKVKGTIHWVSARHAVAASVRLYEHLFTVENPCGEADFLASVNGNSLQIVEAQLEPSLAAAQAGERFQFERQGYFFVDPIDSSACKPVFNRIITLKDSWTKKQGDSGVGVEASAVKQAPSRQVENKPAASGKPVAPLLTPQQQERADQYRQEYKLGDEEARLIAQDDKLASFFEKALEEHHNPQGIANWIVNELLRTLKETTLEKLPFGPIQLAELVSLVDQGAISGKTAKELFGVLAKEGGSPAAIVDERHWTQISDVGHLSAVVDKLFAAHPNKVEQLKLGNQRLVGFFVGMAMKETDGRANPDMVNELLMTKIGTP
jgi:glutaminyl-tRNA synthetase